MATQSASRGNAPYCMMITFEISPADEAEFNEIYDTDHIPNILKLDGLIEVIRFRDATPLVATGRLQLAASEARFHRDAR